MKRKSTKGYVVWYNQTKCKWKACFASLMRTKLSIYSHQYVRFQKKKRFYLLWDNY